MVEWPGRGKATKKKNPPYFQIRGDSVLSFMGEKKLLSNGKKLAELDEPSAHGGAEAH